MKWTILALVGVSALAGAIATTAPLSGQSDSEAAPIYGLKIPDGYRDWRLIAVKQLTGKPLTGAGGELKQFARPIGQRSCDQGLSRRNSAVPGWHNYCRSALE
jgi:hypothetical protein